MRSVFILLVCGLLGSVKSTKSPWWAGALIYQIEVGSFKDSNGDCVGDLRGITDKIKYLKELGVDVVDLSQIFSETDLKNINPKYGDMNSFHDLIDKLHQAGLKVILDYAPSYTSVNHPWFQGFDQNVTKYLDYYIGYFHQLDWPSPSGEDSWYVRKCVGLPFGLRLLGPDKPHLNFTNEEVVEEITDVFRFWIKQGVDGFRLKDISYLLQRRPFKNEEEIHMCMFTVPKPNKYLCYVHNQTTNVPQTYDLVKTWRDTINGMYTDKLLLLEPYAQFTFNESAKYFSYGADSIVNPVFSNITQDTLADTINSRLLDWYSATGSKESTIMLGSSDTARVGSRMTKYQVDSLNMAGLLLPGSFMAYYGDELGMVDNRNGSSKVPFQWDDSKYAGFSNCSFDVINPNYWEVNYKDENTKELSHLNIFKRVAQLRKKLSSAKKITLYNVNNSTLMFTRNVDSATYIFIANLGIAEGTYDIQKQIGNSLPPSVQVHTPSVNSGYSMGEKVNTGKLKLRPKAALVLTTATVVVSKSIINKNSLHLTSLSIIITFLYTRYIY